MHMGNKDINGREYARLSKLKAGDQVEVDDNFDCLRSDKQYTIRQDHSGPMYIVCNMGRHGLTRQLADDEDHLVGIYPAQSIGDAK